MDLKASEREMRRTLGIPEDAGQVIIFGESSHWDPNWLFSSEGYYKLRVRHTLEAAVKALLAEPRRVFSVECVFFLKMFWERRPDRQGSVRDLVNQGRLRLTGSGITTPDTLIPELESIIRDYLIGQEWLRENGMDQEPRLAYLPDDFGHSPALPGILSSLGYDYAAVSRIDGMFFPGADYRGAGYFPRPGSTAQLLMRDLKTADFIWRGPDGSKVLCHWNPFTYFQGDMIASAGAARWMGLTIGLPSRSPSRVAKRIEVQARRLARLARTPYLFCPIGCDFNDPIAGLVSLLDQYNQGNFQRTGLFALNAGMDDYLNLVSCHREKLPEIEADPNPCWMGFYATRPEMKQRCKKLVMDLVEAEKLIVSSDPDRADTEVRQWIKKAWETAAVSNHHDFITGTSPERVWKREQLPWLVEAQALADRALESARGGNAARPAPAPRPEPPTWSREGGSLKVENGFYQVEIDEASGGCITRWADPATGEDLLSGPGNDVVVYKDTGGLWRMGHEYNGGAFVERVRSSRFPASVRAAEREGVLEVTIDSELEGRKLVRTIWFAQDSPVVRMRIRGSARSRRTLTCRFPTGLGFREMVMDVPGGVVSRPLLKIYDPTFWSVSSFVHLPGRNGGGMAVFPGGPGCVCCSVAGAVELVCLRNAPMELAFGFLPVLGHPARGPDPGEHDFFYAVMFTRSGDWLENGCHLVSGRTLGSLRADDPGLEPSPFPVRTDREDVAVTAVKPADRGDGLIVRLFSYGSGEAEVESVSGEVVRASLCDARERDRDEVPVEGGRARVPLGGAITTLRLILG